MELKNQLTNLELSKRMAELGFKQESLFWWVGDRYSKDKNYRIVNEKYHNPKLGYEIYSAYTVAELGEMLPWYLKQDSDRGISFSTETDGLKIDRISIGWTIQYKHINFSDKTEADARAKMLIYLKKNKLI